MTLKRPKYLSYSFLLVAIIFLIFGVEELLFPQPHALRFPNRVWMILYLTISALNFILAFTAFNKAAEK